MSASELRNLIFEKLFAEFVEGREEPLAFVGIQGDGLLVVMQPGGEHLAVKVMPATVQVPNA